MSERERSNASTDGQAILVGPVDEAEVRLRAEGEAIVAQVEELSIDDDDSFVVGTELLASIRRSARTAESFMSPIVAKAHELWRITTDRRGLLLRPREQAAKILTEKLGAYDRERRRLAAEAARAEEARRLLEARKAQEERARALEAAGHTAVAEVVRSAPAAISPVAMAPAPKPAAGVTLRETWEVEVVDAKLVPREYLIVDVAAVRAAVRRSAGTLVIPGVRNVSTSTSTVRG